MINRKSTTVELFRSLNHRNNLNAQKARLKWLKDGDLNTSFFHKTINFRRKKNEIPGLVINGSWTDKVEEVRKGVREFFRNHFSKSKTKRPKLVASSGDRKLMKEDNKLLTDTFTEKEVIDAISDCDSSKSPGPDGFNFYFIKECWYMIREDILRMLGEFQIYGKIVKGLNPSFIALIPKKEGATDLCEYRPISLIGSVYKILSKILATRFSKVIGRVISVNQSAFIGERYILDGVVILNEAIEEAKRRHLKRLLFKIDFAKAYDLVEWRFLEEMLNFFNFDRRWTRWIMECVSTAHAFILVNGSPSGEFKLERGLRQGDPLSLFLYLLVAEGLNILVSRAVENGWFKAAKLGCDKVKVPLLQYADDTIFLGEASEENVVSMRRILRMFEMLSGLKVNFHKSSLVGINIERGELDSMANILKCEVGSIPFSSLGIRVGIKCRKK